MSFRNQLGQKISYDCERLIRELQMDILENGDDFEVMVVTQEYQGVKVYKDYNFVSDEGIGFELEEGEKVEIINAKELLELYKKENEIF